MMISDCPSCGNHHDQPYMVCHACSEPMNYGRGRYSGVTLELPRHFTRANEGGYTQRELMRENDDAHFADQGGRKVLGAQS